MEIQGIIQGWIIYLLFLVGSAICVAGKFSFVQLRSEYINERIEEGEVHARKLLPFYQAPEYFLGAAQLGVIISLSCLLYTSPSPRDRQKSRMPSSA